MLGPTPGSRWSFTSASGHVQTRPDGPDKGPGVHWRATTGGFAPSAGSIES